MTRREDIERLLDAGSSCWLVTQQLSDNELKLLWIAGGKGGYLTIVVLNRTSVSELKRV